MNEGRRASRRVKTHFLDFAKSILKLSAMSAVTPAHLVQFAGIAGSVAFTVSVQQSLQILQKQVAELAHENAELKKSVELLKKNMGVAPMSVPLISGSSTKNSELEKLESRVALLEKNSIVTSAPISIGGTPVFALEFTSKEDSQSSEIPE